MCQPWAPTAHLLQSPSTLSRALPVSLGSTYLLQSSSHFQSPAYIFRTPLTSFRAPPIRSPPT